MAAIGIVFSVIYLALAWLLLIASIHGPEQLPAFAGGYAVLALTVLWAAYFFIRRQRYSHGIIVFSILGFLLAGLAFVTERVAWRVWWFADERRVAQTKVWDVHDEVLLSKHGNPIGFRLTYSVQFPTTRWYYPLPYLAPEDPYLNEAGVEISSTRTIRQNFGAWVFRAGVPYRLVVDVVPLFLMPDASRDSFCIYAYGLSAERLRLLRQVLNSSDFNKNTRYKVWISGTSYAGFTENYYNLRTFYDSAVKEGATECKGP